MPVIVEETLNMTGPDAEPPCHSAPESCDEISGCRLLGLHDFMYLRLYQE